MSSNALTGLSLLFLTMQIAAGSVPINNRNWTNSNRLLIGFQAPWNLSFPFSALRLGSAIQIAVEKINTNPSFLGNYTLTFTYVDSDCDAKTSLGAFIQQVWKENVSAVFGPACPEAAEVG